MPDLEHLELFIFNKCSGLKYFKSAFLVLSELLEHLERTF